MARLRNLGMPFGSPGGIINIPAPAGSALAGQIQMQSMQGLGQALGMYLGQRQAGQLRQEDIRRLQAMGPQQDIFNTMYGARGMQAPQAQMPQMESPMGQKLALQGQLGNIFGTPYGKPPWWVQGATPEQIEDYKGRVGGPLVQIGEKLLSPEQRQEVAEADYREKLTTKALTPTEMKGVQTTIKDIMGEGQTLPFGIRPGPAISQENMSAKWKETMESTGYAGRNKIQQKQIEREFDRYIAMLNKGKGAGVLKGQYKWDRRKYKAGESTSKQRVNVLNRRAITATNPKTGKRIQSFDGGKTWQPVR